MHVGAWAISNAWSGCLAFLANNLTNTQFTQEQLNSTTACLAERGTTDFAIDPCCNQTCVIRSSVLSTFFTLTRRQACVHAVLSAEERAIPAARQSDQRRYAASVPI